MQTTIKMNLSGRLSAYDEFGRIKAISRDAGGKSSFNYSANRVTENRGDKISWKESDS